jgi:hypothetical protein
MLTVSPDQYQQISRQEYSILPGDRFDFGILPLQPYDVQFQLMQSCNPLSNNGGLCRYKVRIANRTTNPLKGVVWSNMSGPTIPVPGAIPASLPSEVKFQTGRIRVDLAPQDRRDSSKLLEFAVFIPANVPSTTQLCTDVWFGIGESAPSFNVRGFRDSLFCFQKQDAGDFVFK